MRIGIFGDVHANLEALKAVLKFYQEQQVDRLFCTGDLVGYGPDPSACLQLIIAHRVIAVAGNHDWGVAGKTPLDSFNPDAARVLIWTRNQLSLQEIGYLDSLPLTAEYGTIRFFHAAPSAPDRWYYIFTATEAWREIAFLNAPIGIIGHTHIPKCFVAGEDQPVRTLPPTGFQIQPGLRYLVNTGSVGQPRDGDPRACCVILDTEKSLLTFHRVAYDFTITQSRMRQAGLPERLALRLALGR